ncbi:MAG TPA: hypothetical protein VFQ35_11730 [Polyangiaceae bacterium]|nr:hypothetical protein [Polyangiaceae bacterium]
MEPQHDTDYLGDGQGCIDPGSLKRAAADGCQTRGLVLTEIFPVTTESCPNGAVEAKYQCCPASGLL